MLSEFFIAPILRLARACYRHSGGPPTGERLDAQLEGLRQSELGRELVRREDRARFVSTRKALESANAGNLNESTRDAWVSKMLGRVRAGEELLDAGAGEQRYRTAAKHLRYVSQDFAQYTGSGDGAGLQTGAWDAKGSDIISDITSIPVQDGRFGALLCTEVLEHVPSPIVALQEFARVLKADGDLFVTVPFASMTHFSPYYFYTGFSPEFFAFHLPRLGFEIVEIQRSGNYFECLAQEMRRLPDIAGRMVSEAAPFDGAELASAAERLNLFLDSLSRASKAEAADLLCYGVFVHAVRRRS